MRSSNLSGFCVGYLDKLIDELAKGKKMATILRRYGT
ncbi:MAG TPA: DUF2200 family protein [Polyangia bacterium]|nr:DUF2200 family protein [Polyangia bacterium]